MNSVRLLQVARSLTLKTCLESRRRRLQKRVRAAALPYLKKMIRQRVQMAKSRRRTLRSLRRSQNRKKMAPKSLNPFRRAGLDQELFKLPSKPPTQRRKPNLSPTGKTRKWQPNLSTRQSKLRSLKNSRLRTTRKRFQTRVPQSKMKSYGLQKSKSPTRIGLSLTLR